MALNAFGMNVPANRSPRLSPKQVQEAFRKQRQEDARRAQAERDRQRERDRNRPQPRVSSSPRPRPPKGPQDAIDNALPRGTKYTTDQVEWLDKYEGEAREKKEQELLQSLRDRGITTFTEGDGTAAWIEDTQRQQDDDDWEIDFSPTARGIYDNSTINGLQGR